MDPATRALLRYSTQILLVVCIAAVAAALARLSVPAARLAYWRGVGALCLALPFLATTATDAPAVSVAFGMAPGVAGEPGHAAQALMTAGAAVPWVWAGGLVARIGWLLAGARRLRQLRRRGVPAIVGAEVDAQRAALAPRAEFLWSLELTQPATFGILRPVVLLPVRFGELSAEARSAVACHELLHVKRRDWVWMLVEELARTVFWFHPGVWWLVDQVQLAREQVIDRLVVGRASKPAYMSAIMTFADRGRIATLSNALFRRRHLQSRFRQLSKEPHMSSRRLAWTVAALTLVMGFTAIGAARALPLDLQALTQDRSGRLEIRLAETAPAPTLTEAVVSDSNQRVYLHATALATNGDVTGANVLDMGGQFGVGVSFGDAASARILEGTATHLGKPVAIVLDGRVIAAPTLRAPIVRSAVISGSFSAEAATALAARLSPGTVQNVTTPPGLAQPPPIRRMVTAYTDEPRTAETDGTIWVNAVQRADGSFGDAIVLPVPITRVRPEYTSEARAARIEGTVWLDAIVLRDGSVGDVAVVRSLDSALGLDRQAVSALKQWQWRAATKGGKPEPVSVRVEMTFTLK